MIHHGDKVENIKIAYIGGGSRGWAWRLMSDLVEASDISGDVYLYDIDMDAAKANEIIGNMYNDVEGAKSVWKYHAANTIDEALTGADFIVISILPGTFDEMESDVHAPEEYGIYQSVGDTAGPGGIVRAMRTIPMFEEIAENIKKYSPDAWVINYTNPMTLCIKTLYRVFPEIKAFGCCHEVFGTQSILSRMIKEEFGEDAKREDVKVNPVGVNHFTWLTSAKYKNIDLFPYYAKFCEKHKDGLESGGDDNWMNSTFHSEEKVKFDLFNKFGYIAAAGDRHLAEFCEGKWYLESPERVREMKFGLTTVAFRKEDLKERLETSRQYITGEKKLEITPSGEEGVSQMRAILGLGDIVTNVNIPNVGQIPNLPVGAVVETNAVFRSGSVTPVMAGEIPKTIYSMISRVCAEQEAVSDAIANRDIEAIFMAFAGDPLVTISVEKARELFAKMINNTSKYLQDYDIENFRI
ncbi:MAG: alpha-glucosidase/alpha-galactosidase [Ruminococcaceae bacterium]|nr:alpha-glucosidase/alpha-galactosidase [Oscillospiraceae bacterium]